MMRVKLLSQFQFMRIIYSNNRALARGTVIKELSMYLQSLFCRLNLLVSFPD